MNTTMSPRTAAAAVARDPHLPSGPDEAVTGFGVMGLPFASGHYLSLRDFPAASFLPGAAGYRSVWHRDPAGAWTFCGLSFDEGAGASGTAMVVNGVASLHNGAATSPSAAAATYPAQIGSSGAGASGMLTNNSRLGLLLAWDNVALGANALLALFEETRGRFSV